MPMQAQTVEVPFETLMRMAVKANLHSGCVMHEALLKAGQPKQQAALAGLLAPALQWAAPLTCMLHNVLQETDDEDTARALIAIEKLLAPVRVFCMQAEAVVNAKPFDAATLKLHEDHAAMHTADAEAVLARHENRRQAEASPG